MNILAQDHELLEAVRMLYAAGETDLAAGGVHPESIGEELGIDMKTATHRCRELADEGRLVRQDGLNPETLQSRISYAPVDKDESNTERPQRSGAT
ncbi:hypothetical protein [Halorussus marinus]|uniref:hypothetical protein n=1 Tax=Halorussus marinus TaxID=2505976 RepID=UPI0010925A9A|nr:hypothetical protein [Halorussus marinus]